MDPKQSPPAHLKLEDVVASIGAKNLKITLETKDSPLETKAKLEQSTADAAHQREKDRFLYRAITFLVCAVSLVCLIASFLPAIPEDSRKWATTVLSSIVSGALGYVTGRANK